MGSSIGLKIGAGPTGKIEASFVDSIGNDIRLLWENQDKIVGRSQLDKSIVDGFFLPVTTTGKDKGNLAFFC